MILSVAVYLRGPAFAALIVAMPAVAAAQNVQWVRQFGGAAHDRASAIAVGASGIYVAGATEGALPGQQSAGAIDAFVRKYSPDGTELWTRQFGNAGVDEILAIAVDASGVYVAGGTQGPLNRPGAPGAPHAFVRKYDADGAEVWTREFGTARREEVLAVAIGAAGIYAAGDTTVTSPPYDDGFVAQVRANGTMGWSRWLATASPDRASAVAVDASGVYVAGATEGALPGQASTGDSDSFLRKFDFEGTEIWTRQFGTSAGDEILSMTLDASGLYVVGTTAGVIEGQSGAGEVDAFLSKGTLNGRTVWTEQFGSAAHDEVLAVASDGSASYAVGVTEGALGGEKNNGSFDAFVIKLRP